VTEKYVNRWVRWWTRHSHGHSDWRWQEFLFPAKLTSIRALNKFFHDEYASDLNCANNTQSEHWRGIGWEIIDPSTLIIEKEIASVVERIECLQQRLKQLREFLPQAAPAQKTDSPCTRFPNCGCIVEGKHTECRRPRGYIMNHPKYTMHDGRPETSDLVRTYPDGSVKVRVHGRGWHKTGPKKGQAINVMIKLKPEDWKPY